MSEKKVKLSGRQQMLKRLIAMNSSQYLREKFYPLLLEYAGQEKTANDMKRTQTNQPTMKRIITCACFTSLLLMFGCDKSNAPQDVEGLNRDVLIDRGISLKVIETDIVTRGGTLLDTGEPGERIVLKMKVVGRDVPFALLKGKGYSGNVLKSVVTCSIQPKENSRGTVWENRFFYPDSQGQFNIPNAFDSLAGNLREGEEELITLESLDGMIDRVEISIRRPGERYSKFILRNIELVAGRSE